MFKTLVTANELKLTELADVKTRGKFHTSDQDEELKPLQLQAEKFVSKYTGKSILTETWDLTYDKNEVSNFFSLQGLNATVINSYKVTDVSENETTVTSTKYRLSNGNIIFDTPTSAGATDGVGARFYDAVVINIDAGFADTRDALPEDLTLAIEDLITWMQINKAENPDLNFLPKNFKKLIMPYVNTKSWIG